MGSQVGGGEAQGVADPPKRLVIENMSRNKLTKKLKQQLFFSAKQRNVGLCRNPVSPSQTFCICDLFCIFNQNLF
jgi:hypothetical protein